ncbi:transmembrane protein, putative (macronuclear) [Tetrahymena thermophila SB210]|uniref:Transmembrane protein, putative n=1 Tax=Tetrahymena thermophila (strain SB210) TaxID=312017 RepID=Q24GA8_TETTS|nr:transmembrane protein, putative [Tetrahymena thermophila SB210]EAS06822.2 transmembrane protein, putative [Tetrahymena thermophila SB210]|eukprot:XP_001027064.2 transmembrane protein, putative [Tetrahymena thermophila SB210]
MIWQLINKQKTNLKQNKKMNKLLALLLVSLLVCQATAFSFRLSDSGEDKGEDNGEFSGAWYEESSTDKGEVVDQGEFHGNYFFYDNGEINIAAFYQKQQYNRQDLGENIYESDKLYDQGELLHVGLDGQLTKEDVANLVLKRLRSKKN